MDPARRKQVAVLAAIGCAIACWLALFQLGWVGPPWDPLFDGGTEQVLRSHVATWFQRTFGLPDAGLGAVAYAAEAILCAAGPEGRLLRGLTGAIAVGLGVAGVALVLLQAFVVGAFCLLCLASAAISIANAFLAGGELIHAIRGEVG